MFITLKNISRFTRGEKAVAAVELALILPILLIILFGIVEISTIFYDKAVITNASREAARAGIVNSSISDLDIQSYAQNYCQNKLITFGGSKTPIVTVSRPSGSSSGNPLIVTVSFQFTGLALGTIVRPQNWDQTLTSTSTMNFE